MNNQLFIIFIISLCFLSCKKDIKIFERTEIESPKKISAQIGTNSDKEENPIDIFENDIFQGIASSPTYYENDPRFNITEDHPKDDMERRYYDYRILVKNDDIQIEYWINNTICQLQAASITGDTEISKWGKYIGLSKEDVLSLFGAPRNSADAELHYFREDGEFGVHFWLLNNVIKRISLVGSI